METTCPNCGGREFRLAKSIDGTVHRYCASCDNPTPIGPNPAMEGLAPKRESDESIGARQAESVEAVHKSDDISEIYKDKHKEDHRG